MNDELLAEINKLKERGINFVIVTLVNVRGSAPQEIGARMIVGKNGLLFGTIGGGKVEEKTIEHAKILLESAQQNNFVEWNLQTDVKMTCGGVVSLFFEKIMCQSDWKIAVFGAGHVSQELIRILVKLDCDITCIDPRLEWLQKLPDDHKIKKIQTDEMSSILKTLSPKTFLISVTMGHSFDLPILKLAMKEFHFPYIGVIGSESKANVIKKDLLEFGIDEKTISQLHCPIGEAIGSNHPVEIAISIVAQLLMYRDSR